MLEKYKQIFEQIKKAQKILITFPALWNGDAISSALAFYLLLKKLNKTVDIISTKNELSEHISSALTKFSFLPEFKNIRFDIEEMGKFVISLDTSKTKIKKINYKVEDNSIKFFVSPKDGSFSAKDIKTSTGLDVYDLIITLDAPDFFSLGEIFQKNTDFFYNTPIINIDHKSSNEEYGQINHVNINAVSTSEILFSLFNDFDEKIIDHDIATCLLTGIITKTKNFKTANITPNTLQFASQLILKEARKDEIVNNLYRSRSLKIIKLWGKVLANLSSLKENKIVWSTINTSDFLQTNTTSADLSDIIDELIVNIPEAEIIIVFYEDHKQNPENKESFSNLLIHTPRNMDITQLTREYNPEGTEKLVRIRTQKNLKEIKKEIIDIFNKKISQYNF